jgi:hypothetical protein
MELIKFLTDHLKLSQSQIDLIQKDDATNEEIIEVTKKISENNISLFKSSSEFKEDLDKSKKAGFAEGSRKVKKAITSSFGVTVENIDEIDGVDLAKTIKENLEKTPDAKFTDLEKKLFESNTKLSEYEKAILEKEAQIKSEYQKKYNGLIVGKKKAEFLTNKNLIIPTNAIDLILKGKEANGEFSFVVNDKDEIEVYGAGGRLLNDKQNGHLTFEEFLEKEINPFVSNNNGAPNGVPQNVNTTSTDTFSADMLAEIERYKQNGIAV